jgi:TIR domain-containing protein
MDNSSKRFAVALSFPGEHRQFVRNVASRLAEELGKERVFFDEWYQAELLGTSGDLKLKQIYRDETDLVVPFFSEHYKKKWCKIEWHAIRVVFAERQKDDAVVPVQLDGTPIEGWESIDLAIRRGRKTGRRIAEEILAAYRLRQRRAGVEPLRHRLLLRNLERSIADGELRDSLIAPIVLAALSEEKELELARDYDPRWIATGIRLSDEYFVRVRSSAGYRDWQRDFAQTVVPTLVGVSQSLDRSADAQALIIRLCNSLTSRLRLRLVWPDDGNRFNAMTNAIYSACLEAMELESDSVLMELKKLSVKGPM